MCLVQDAANDINLTIRATDNPDDPLGHMLPEQGGSLMPHRLCAENGTDSGTEGGVRFARLTVVGIGIRTRSV